MRWENRVKEWQKNRDRTRKMMRASGIGVLLCAALSAATLKAIPAGAEVDEASPGGPVALHAELARFGDVFEAVRAAYVEEVSDEALIQAAIKGMLGALDPHSTYLPPDDFQALRSRNSGTFGGIGVELREDLGRVMVVDATDGAPAARAGIRPGDVITHVDGESIQGRGLREAIALMRGAVGTPARLTLRRPGEEDGFAVEVTREAITVRTVRSSLEEGILVLRLSAFNAHAYPMLEAAVAGRVAEAGGLGNIAGVVLDLRNNPGGLVVQAVQVSDAFLDRGAIVSTRGRDPERAADFAAGPGDIVGGKPMVVLINSRSVSAAEIVAGALQDNGRAIVVGTQSYGKGSVQTIAPIAGKGGIKLTTSRYFTPSGRSIHGLGITPDIVVEAPPQVAPAADAPASDGPHLRAEDPQLAHALDLLHGLALLAPAGPRPPAPVRAAGREPLPAAIRDPAGG
jgi:carboxyl-terminal processing protease